MSKSSSNSSTSSTLKRKVQVTQPTPPPVAPTSAKQIKKDPTIEKPKSQRTHSVPEDEIIRSRLIYEGDQGMDDRRILNLMKSFQKSIYDVSTPIDITTTEKLLSTLYAIENSYRVLKSTLQMDEREQLCYAMKCKRMNEEVRQLRHQLDENEVRLIDAKQKRLNMLEYDARAATINKLGTRRELRAQQAATLERKHYFEHLQQTFEANYQQRLKQIAVYMRPIFELDEILRQDAHEDLLADGTSETVPEQTSMPPTPTLKLERQRTNSDSSTASIDGDETGTGGRPKRQHKIHLPPIPSSILLINTQPQPLYLSDNDLYGTTLINPKTLVSTVCSSSIP